MSIQSGNIYQIYNGKSGTVFDLSGTDGRTVFQTIMATTDNGISSKDQVVTEPSAAPLLDGTPLASVNEPFGWDTYPDDEDSSVFRVYVLGAPTATNIDLSNHGNATPGTIVTLWIKWEGKNQTWRFEQA
ncbi:carbohydrate-binding module family 13 protein [Lentinula guzmanii]|uniref:Carbohydrate-binding module family 13 protein n=1 Tax=Lentinula guzmanii TaxID=2804957 RepID=A0AA38JQM0_9AGAR|nr:carbohydrate-binding module family 13 protein [Lentinula guzmanii]